MSIVTYNLGVVFPTNGILWALHHNQHFHPSLMVGVVKICKCYGVTSLNRTPTFDWCGSVWIKKQTP